MFDALDTREALELCGDLLREQCAQTDTASPEGHLYRCALATVEALLEQRGCEHLDPAVRDGKLTTFCDIAMFG
jgi:hypothetical protein